MIKICGHCKRRGGNWCDKAGRAPYNRVACAGYEEYPAQMSGLPAEKLNDPQPEVQTYQLEVSIVPSKREITPELVDLVIQTYKQTSSVNRTSQIAKLDWQNTKNILSEAKLYPPSQTTENASHVPDEPDTSPASAPMQAASENGNSQEVSENGNPVTDFRQTLVTDLEEAQRAMLLLDTIREVYGEAPELERAVMDIYRRRRAA